MTPKPAAQMSKPTPTPWRVGDAGYTVFGPPNGNPSPETIANTANKLNAAFIVRAVNAHEELVSMLKGELLDRGDERRYTREEIKQAIAKAEGRDA